MLLQVLEMRWAEEKMLKEVEKGQREQQQHQGDKKVETQEGDPQMGYGKVPST